MKTKRSLEKLRTALTCYRWPSVTMPAHGLGTNPPIGNSATQKDPIPSVGDNPNEKEDFSSKLI